MTVNFIDVIIVYSVKYTNSRNFIILLYVIFIAKQQKQLIEKDGDKMNKNAVVIVSFGTSYESARLKTIDVFINNVQNKYEEHDIYNVFTNPTIRKIIRTRDNIVINDLQTTIKLLKNKNYENIIFQPTYIINGYEFENMRDTIIKHIKDFKSIHIGSPLLTTIDDYDIFIDEAIKEFNITNNNIYIFVGHGTLHHANATYMALERKFNDRGYVNVFIGTIKCYPSIDTVLKNLQSLNRKKVILIPLLFVAGDHVTNDIFGDEDNSWKSILKRNGYEVDLISKGLGEYQSIRDIYINHMY